MPNKKRINDIYNKYNGKCAYCGEDIKMHNFHIDHIISKQEGGDNSLDNLNPSCIPYNMSKGCLSIESFRNKLKFYSMNLVQEHTIKIYNKYYNNPIIGTIGSIIFYFEKQEQK